MQKKGLSFGVEIALNKGANDAPEGDLPSPRDNLSKGLKRTFLAHRQITTARKAILQTERASFLLRTLYEMCYKAKGDRGLI